MIRGGGLISISLFCIENSDKNRKAGCVENREKISVSTLILYCVAPSKNDCREMLKWLVCKGFNLWVI